MDSFWTEEWLHCIPREELWVEDRRCILKHLCFAPLETQVYYITKNDRCYCEYHIIEGIQEGEQYVNEISLEDMLNKFNVEIELCRKYQVEGLISALQAEKNKLENIIHDNRNLT